MTDEQKMEAAKLFSTLSGALERFERSVDRNMRMCSSEPAESIRDLSLASKALVECLREFSDGAQALLCGESEVSND